MDFSPGQRKQLYEHLSDEELAEIVQELEYELQKQIINEIGASRSAQVLAEMSSDGAADLIGELPEGKQHELFQLLDKREASEIKGLLKHPETSAGGLMTTEYNFPSKPVLGVTLPVSSSTYGFTCNSISSTSSGEANSLKRIHASIDGCKTIPQA